MNIYIKIISFLFTDQHQESDYCETPYHTHTYDGHREQHGPPSARRTRIHFKNFKYEVNSFRHISV